jgi:hypothetical protein
VKYSVVIPTKGENDLCYSLLTLKHSFLPPTEICVILPENLRCLNIFPLPCNVRLLYSARTGQTNQRLVGIAAASHSFILQGDSTILYSYFCTYNLLAFLANNSGAVVGAHILPSEDYVSTFWKILSRPYKYAVSKYLSDSRTPSILLRLGFPGNPYIYAPGSHVIYKSIWVNGIIAYRKKDYPLVNHYPFRGKAYSEDIINTIRFKRLGLSLWIASDAVAFSRKRPEYIGFSGFIIYACRFLRAKMFVAYTSSPLLVLPSLVLGITLLVFSSVKGLLRTRQ